MIQRRLRSVDEQRRRAQSKFVMLRFTCDGCGRELAQIKQRVFEASPATSKALVVQAQRKHIAETGCSGEKQDGIAGEVQAIAGRMGGDNDAG